MFLGSVREMIHANILVRISLSILLINAYFYCIYADTHMVERNVNTGQVSNLPSTTSLGYQGHPQQPGHGSVPSCQT